MSVIGLCVVRSGVFFCPGPGPRGKGRTSVVQGTVALSLSVSGVVVRVIVVVVILIFLGAVGVGAGAGGLVVGVFFPSFPLVFFGGIAGIDDVCSMGQRTVPPPPGARLQADRRGHLLPLWSWLGRSDRISWMLICLFLDRFESRRDHQYLQSPVMNPIRDSLTTNGWTTTLKQNTIDSGSGGVTIYH